MAALPGVDAAQRALAGRILAAFPERVSESSHRVLEKLGLSNNAELTVYAIRNELV